MGVEGARGGWRGLGGVVGAEMGGCRDGGRGGEWVGVAGAIPLYVDCGVIRLGQRHVSSTQTRTHAHKHSHTHTPVGTIQDYHGNVLSTTKELTQLHSSLERLGLEPRNIV